MIEYLIAVALCAVQSHKTIRAGLPVYGSAMALAGTLGTTCEYFGWKLSMFCLCAIYVVLFIRSQSVIVRYGLETD